MATQRVPAWKRLGLKLKSADPQTETLSTPSAPQRSSGTFQRDAFDSPKRKREQFGDASASRPSLKKPRTDETPLRRQKSVTFADGTDSKKHPGSESKKAKSTPKKKKSPKTPKPQALAAPPDLTAPLEYLRLWKSSRDSWKFNKNHQAHLISHAFDPALLPASDIDIFYEYICDLKGYARTRLLETAKSLCAEDMEEGKDHFPAGTSDVESKKKQYEEIMSNVLRRSQTEPKRKYFNETNFATSRDADPEVARRVTKRMRAEIVAEELSSNSDASEETGDSNVTTTNEKDPSANEASEEPDVGKRVKLNDGTTRPVKRVRASKRRGADLEDSSSDSSDSESDSDSDSDDASGSGSGSGSGDSSSDSSDDSDDDEMDVDAGPNDEETSSSSSSSSDEDEDEDSDEDSESD